MSRRCHEAREQERLICLSPESLVDLDDNCHAGSKAESLHLEQCKRAVVIASKCPVCGASVCTNNEETASGQSATAARCRQQSSALRSQRQHAGATSFSE